MMNENKTENILWSSYRTGWVLYPSVIIFLAIIVWAGDSIHIKLLDSTSVVREQTLWSVLKQELLR